MATAGTPEFTATLIDHVFEIWIWPEVHRRGLQLNRADIRKVIVELEPGKAPRVLLNEKAELEAGFVAKRVIAEGEMVTDLRPVSIEPNSGWLVFARLGSREMITFDFRYNKARASAIVQRASEFLAAARAAIHTSAAVALDLSFSAAELAVHGEMMTLQSDVKNHKERAKWLGQWAENDNAPKSHADLLYNLADLRSSARYGEGQLRIHPDRLPLILRTVEEMIRSAEERIV
jgi:hypothetical protein